MLCASFRRRTSDVHNPHLPGDGIVDPLQGVHEGVDVLAVREDAARHVLLGTEVPRDVGPAVVDEQVLHVPGEARGNALVHQNSVPVQDGVREGVLCNPVQNQVLVQSPGMSLTELVLLHRDAQMLNMEVVMESSKSSSTSGGSDVSRPGSLGDDFVKLFKLKQFPVFSIPVATSSPQQHL